MLDRPRLAVRILHVSRRSQFTWDFSNLSAPYWRFYWNYGGQAWVTSAGARVPLERNVGYLIPPDTDFDAHSTSDLDHFYVHFLVDGLSMEYERGVHRVGNSDRLAPIVASVADSRSPADAVLELSGLVLLAIAAVPELRRPVRSDLFVARAAAFAERHTDRVVSVSELATAAGCGERTLRRRFLAAVGTSPVRFALLQRLDRACILLHFSDATIDQIAQETGFCDRYHFTRAFGRERGVSPAAFRRIAEELNPG